MADNNKQITEPPFSISEDERNRIVSSIERKIQIIKDTATNNDYFLQIGEFYKYLIGSDTMVRLIDVMFSEFRDTQAEFEKLRGQVMEEVNKVFNSLLGKIKELTLLSDDDIALIDGYYNGTKTNINKEEADRLNRNESALFRAVAGFYSWARGKSQTLGGELLEYSLLRATEDVVNALYNSDHKDLVQQYVQIDASNPEKPMIVGYNIAPTESKLREEQTISRTKLEASPWLAYQRLKLVPLCLYDYAEFKAKLSKEDKLADYMNFTGTMGELSEVMAGRRTHEAHYFRRELYNSYLQRVTDKLIDLMDAASRIPKGTLKNVDDAPSKEISLIDMPERPKQLPNNDVNSELCAKYSFKPSDTGGYILRYGNNDTVSFGENDDLARMMQIFSTYPEQWIDFKTIFHYMGFDYERDLKTKNKPLHKLVRRIIADIRDKKLNEKSLGDMIVIQSGKVEHGPVGEGWYRLHFEAP